jgi:hypothetical protein
MKEVAIGYDIRPAIPASATYPVRSVDDRIWPTVWEGFPDLAPKRFKGTSQNLWADLGDLLSEFAKLEGLLDTPWEIVEVTEVVFAGDGEPEHAPAQPRPVEWDGSLLGYDVADYFLLSFRNVWPAPQGLRGLRRDTGLFESAAAAVAGVRPTARAMPRHRPFFVYGVYRLTRAYSLQERS